MPKTKIPEAVEVAKTAELATNETVQVEGAPENTPLEKFREKNDVLLMLYPKDENGYFVQSIDQNDETLVYNAVTRQNSSKKSLLILLDTSGGNVYSAVKIMDLLRSKYKEITIAVPHVAKSSGTMMCCGADKIIMSPISELGPLDKPMIHPDNEMARISALDIVKSIDGMLDTAFERQKEFAEKLNTDYGISIQKSLDIASKTITGLVSPMLCREDVKIYNQAKRLLVIAENYGQEFLNENMLKTIKNKNLRQRMARVMIRRLIWLYPDHSFAIRRNELKDWFFIVEFSEKTEIWPELWKEYEDNRSNKSKNIRFI